MIKGCCREDVSGADSLESLAFLTEVLSGIPLPGDRDLITCLLETLSNVSHSEGRPTAGVAYIEQLLMSCIQNASAAAQVKFCRFRTAKQTLNLVGFRLQVRRLLLASAWIFWWT